MKKILLFISILVVFSNCSDDDKLPLVMPEETGTITDRDGNEYRWVRYNGLDWLASNFKGGEPYYDAKTISSSGKTSYLISFDNKEQAIQDYAIYGNLYTYEEALTNVQMLPEGWRLPTDEDWQKLEQAFGMSGKTSNQTGWRGAPTGELLQQDESGSGIQLLLGGQVSIKAGRPMYLKLREMREYGYFWTSTISEGSYPQGKAVYYRCIRYNTSQVEREVVATTEKDYSDNVYSKYMSVRYVRDAR